MTQLKVPYFEDPGGSMPQQPEVSEFVKSWLHHAQHLALQRARRAVEPDDMIDSAQSLLSGVTGTEFPLFAKPNRWLPMTSDANTTLTSFVNATLQIAAQDGGLSVHVDHAIAGLRLLYQNTSRDGVINVPAGFRVRKPWAGGYRYNGSK